jgi:hypothetical protein
LVSQPGTTHLARCSTGSFVYALPYPTFVGAINLVLNDVILSGMIANSILLWLLLMSIYVLGCWLYGQRRVAWLAVLVVIFNASLMSAMRLFWGHYRL